MKNSVNIIILFFFFKLEISFISFPKDIKDINNKSTYFGGAIDTNNIQLFI